MTAAVLAVAALAAPPAAAAPPPRVLSLAAALRAVAARSTAAEVARLDTRAAGHEVRAVRASRYPSLDLAGGFTDRDSELVAVFGPFAAPLGDDTYWQYRVDARYLLWDGGLRAAGVDAAQARRRATAAGGRARVVREQLTGMAAYLRAVEARARQRAVAKRIEAVRAHLAVVQDLFAQGMVARNDLLQTRVRLRQVEDEAARAADAEVIAVRALARIMGEDPERTVRLPDRLPGPPRLPAGEAALAAAARSRSPEIRALEAELDAARKAARLRGRAGMPKVFAEASHTYEENPYLLHVNANVLFVGLSWNLYDGGARRARLAEARTGVSRVERLLADARRRVANRVDAAYRRYRQALREGRTAARNVAAAEENLRIEEDQYRVGMVTTTEVLDAEALLAASRFELIARHAGAYLRQGELLALAGEDLAAFYDHRAEGSVRSEDGS